MKPTGSPSASIARNHGVTLVPSCIGGTSASPYDSYTLDTNRRCEKARSSSPTRRTISGVISTSSTRRGRPGRRFHARHSSARISNLASSDHTSRTSAAERAVPMYRKPLRSSTRADATFSGSIVAATRWTLRVMNNQSTTAFTASTA